MPTTEPRIDDYIASKAPFAQPILQQLRALIHEACPEVVETIKWGHPAFEYQGILCGLAGFKHYASLGFWKEKLLREVGHADIAVLDAVGKLQSVDQLPSDAAVIQLIQEAMRLNTENIKPTSPARKNPEKKPAVMPDYFTEALQQHPSAQKTFEAFSPSAKRDYVEWLEEAKTEATRTKRLSTAIEWIAEGKQRHWKYQTRK